MSDASASYTRSIVGNTAYYDAMERTISAEDRQSDAIGKVDLRSMIREQGVAVRSLRMSLNTGLFALSALGIANDENNEAVKILHSAVIAGMFASGIYSMLKAVSLSQTAWQTSLATVEASAAAIAQNWAALAAAGIAFGAVYGAFQVSQSQSIVSSADVSTPQGRREADRVLRGVATS
jgi:hypothetical protein